MESWFLDGKTPNSAEMVLVNFLAQMLPPAESPYYKGIIVFRGQTRQIRPKGAGQFFSP